MYLRYVKPRPQKLEPKLLKLIKVTEKTFQEMYINVGGWQTVKNDPNKNGMTYASHTLPSLHLFTILLKCVLCWNIRTQVVCATYGCWKQASARWESSESLCWMMSIVEF